MKDNMKCFYHYINVSPRPLRLVAGFKKESYQQWVKIESGIIWPVQAHKIIQGWWENWSMSLQSQSRIWKGMEITGTPLMNGER